MVENELIERKKDRERDKSKRIFTKTQESTKTKIANEKRST